MKNEGDPWHDFYWGGVTSLKSEYIRDWEGRKERTQRRDKRPTCPKFRKVQRIDVQVKIEDDLALGRLNGPL